MRRASALLSAAFVAGCGTDVAGPAASLFSCLVTDAAALAVGDVVQVGGAGNRGLCLADPDGGAEFVYIPFHAADPEGAAPLPVTVYGAGLAPVAGPPNPSPLPPGRVVALRNAAGAEPPHHDPAFHLRLRRAERQELGARIRPLAPGVSPAEPWPAVRAATVPEVGDLVSYNVAISCDASDYRTGRVEHVSDRAIVVADVENPEGLTAADYQHFGETFDTLVDPVVLTHFGAPTDIDGNGRTIIFFTRAVNELTPPSAAVITAGFFWSGDLFPEEATPRAQACPGGNQAEMFYMLAADPLGVAGRPFTAEFVRRESVPVIAHEYQHLINAGRRLYVNEAAEFEEPWLNEGLSHVAEELMFYAATGSAPGQNLGYDELDAIAGAVTAFNTFMSGNFSNYARYLQRPDTASPMGSADLATRGASWSFLRYAADRSGRGDAEFFRSLVDARNAGLENLGAALGADPLAWMRDWTVSVYADDAVPVVPRLLQPSWNFRALYARSSVGSFPLRVVPLDAAADEAFRLPAGGTAFPRFGVGEDGVAVLHVESEGGTPPRALRGSYLRTR